MDNMGDKIIELLDVVYDLSDEAKQKLVLSVEWLSKEDKERILVAVYRRYEAFEKNIKKLNKGVQHLSNHLEEEVEHQNAENVLLDL